MVTTPPDEAHCSQSRGTRDRPSSGTPDQHSSGAGGQQASSTRRRLIRMLLAVGGVLFVTELAVMCVLPALGLEGMWENVADSLLLALLALGPLYFLGFRSHAVTADGGKAEHNFRLFRYFIGSSVAAASAVLLLVGFGLRSVLKDHVIVASEHFSEYISDALRDREADVLVRNGPDGQQELVIHAEDIPELDRRMRTFLAPFDVLKIKVFDRDTRIIYSTDPTIIGELNPNNPKLESALSGVAVSKLEDKDHVWDLADEQRYEIDLVETYVPVVGAQGRVLGAFEVYKDVSTHIEAGRKTLVRCVIILGVVLLAVFAGLSAMMHRASRIISSRTNALEESRCKLKALNDELEQRVEERTAELARTVTELEVARDRAEAASRAKTEFLSNVGHEFKTPLNSIMGYSETMQRLNERGKYDRLAECAKTVQEMSHHLSRLVDDVMDISAIEAERVEICLEEVSPASLCRQVQAHCAGEVQAKGLTFDLDVSDDLPPVRADVTRLTQILINLVDNAVKFTERGSVRVTARMAEGNNDVEFLVSDTGVGIDEKDYERIFKRFERVDTSGLKRGSGLGLAISRKLVESHGGRIWVESTPGKGSVFHVVIAVAVDSAVGVT